MTAGAFGSSHSHASQLICHRVWCGTLQGRATHRSEGASATACAKGREQSPQRPGWKESLSYTWFDVIGLAVLTYGRIPLKTTGNSPVNRV